MRKILLVNDDGITAPGIRALFEAANDLGEVTVIAPTEQQSASSHSVTIEKPITYQKVHFHDDIDAFAVNGSPADAVKMAFNLILENKPDLVLSGINWGANLGASVMYSGTVSAAVESVIHGVPAIAFSLDKRRKVPDFAFAKKVVRYIVSKYNPTQLPKDIVLNINIPNIKESDFKGYSITSQSRSSWKEKYSLHESDSEQPYYVLSGELVSNKRDINGDVYVVARNRVSITPLQLNLTNYQAMTSVERVFME